MTRFLTDEQGTAGIEYALFISLVGVAVVGSLQFLGSSIMDGLGLIDSELTTIRVQEEFKDK